MSYLGQPVKRFEDAKLLTGNGLFINDINLPGMLHAFIIRSIHAHARIRSIDVATAPRISGGSGGIYRARLGWSVAGHTHQAHG